MVDTLVESTANVELILNYFKLFLSLPSEEDMDENGDGTITPREMKDRLEATKNYTREEIDFLLGCCEENHDGKIDYAAFKETYYEPSKTIGFNLAVLLTNLSEHMTNDPRLAKFLETAASVLNFFEAFLGRIEIKTADKVERVYFEIDEANIEEWEKPQIRESKNAFFHVCISEGEGEQMEQFVDFCEDAIFEMQISTALSGDDGEVAKVKKEMTIPGEDEPTGIIQPLKENIALGLEQAKTAAMLLSPANLSLMAAKAKNMTALEKALALITGVFWVIYGIGMVALWFNQKIFGTVLYLMRGLGKQDVKKEKVAEEEIVAPPPPENIDPVAVVAGQDPSDAFASTLGISENLEQIAKEKAEKEELAKQVEEAMKAADEAKKKKAAPSEGTPKIDIGKYTKKLSSFLARNFFTIKFFALVIAFIINFMLLFYKVSEMAADEEVVEDDGMGDADMEDEEPIADAGDTGDGEEGGEEGEDGEDEESPG